MKKTLFSPFLLPFTLLIGMPCSGQNVQLPYFGTIKAASLCGSATKYCQPSVTPLYAPVKGMFYDGDVSSALGRIFTSSIFDSSPICSGKTAPTAADVDIFNRNVFTAKVQQAKQTELGAKLTANFAQLLTERFPQLPADLKADAAAQFKLLAAKKVQQDFQLEYKVIQLKKTYMDAMYASCFNTLQPGQSLTAGISVVTISGTWTSDAIRQVFANIETKASFQTLEAGVKAEFNNAKQTVLSGGFDQFSIIFSVGYKTK